MRWQSLQELLGREVASVHADGADIALEEIPRLIDGPALRADGHVVDPFMVAHRTHRHFPAGRPVHVKAEQPKVVGHGDLRPDTGFDPRR